MSLPTAATVPSTTQKCYVKYHARLLSHHISLIITRFILYIERYSKNTLKSLINASIFYTNPSIQQRNSSFLFVLLNFSYYKIIILFVNCQCIFMT